MSSPNKHGVSFIKREISPESFEIVCRSGGNVWLQWSLLHSMVYWMLIIQDITDKSQRE